MLVAVGLGARQYASARARTPTGSATSQGTAEGTPDSSTLHPATTVGTGTETAHAPTDAAESATTTILPSNSTPASNPPTGEPFAGLPQVGTLFGTSDGSLTSHHCSGSVVSSSQGDIVVTAAHCVYSGSGANTNLAFVPGYDDGAMPYGAWYVTRVVVAQQWISDRDPDYDYAFIVVHKSGTTTPIQDVVGSDTLAVDQSYTALTRVVGYPSKTNQPITCTNFTSEFSATQLQFDCDGYPGGTSGSPFLINESPSTGEGEVDGVIGGYEAGGYSPDVSYSVRFNDATAQLLAEAEAQN